MGGDEAREVDWTHMVESSEYFWRNLYPVADGKANSLSAPWLHLVCSCLCQAVSVTKLRLTSSISYRGHPAPATLEWMGMISTTLFSTQTMLILEDTDQGPPLGWSLLPTPSPLWPLRPTSEMNSRTLWEMNHTLPRDLSSFVLSIWTGSWSLPRHFTTFHKFTFTSPLWLYTSEVWPALLFLCTECHAECFRRERTLGQWVDGPESQQTSSDRNLL